MEKTVEMADYLPLWRSGWCVPAVPVDLGVLLVLASAIGIAVVSIVQMVYLYRMAVMFREYT